MRRQICIASMVLSALGLLPALSSAQTSYTCGSPVGPGPEAMLAGLKARVAGPLPEDSAWRSQVQLPMTPEADVSFVTADSVCDLAARAVAALSTPAAPVQRVWVIAVGATRYVVWGTSRGGPQKLVRTVFDENFVRLVEF